MKRLEIIANKSVQENILQSLETHIEEFSYTLIPVAHGKGKAGSRLGTAIWPEENCMIISYLTDQQAAAAKSLVAAIKANFSREGIVMFFMDAAKDPEPTGEAIP
jgi:hypothetical protein